MIHIISSTKRFLSEVDWLKSYWHFSFDRYYDPGNMSFGNLRVFNEDWIQPGSGFPMHPHKNMEIVTYVIEGELEHRDDHGNRGIIRAGEVQRMTAGRGIMHSEFNPSKDRVCHLLQMWILPAENGLNPDWEQKEYTLQQRRERLLPVVSGKNSHDAALKIHQDAALYISSLQAGESVRHAAQPERRVYVFVIDGTVTLNAQTLNTGDQARAGHEKEYRICAESPAELILIDT